MPIPLSIQFTPKDNTTNCICCSSNASLLNQSNNQKPLETNDNTNRRMIPSSTGLIAERDKAPSIFSRLDCFAEVREIRVNKAARGIFETYLTQQVGSHIANSVLSEHKWTRDGLPLRQQDIQQLSEEAQNIYDSTGDIAKNFKYRKALEVINKTPPQKETIQNSFSQKSTDTQRKTTQKKPLIVSRTDRQLEEVFEPAKIASYIQQISPTLKEQALELANQIEITLTYKPSNKPIDSKEIITSVITALKEQNITIKEAPPLPDELSQYNRFEEIPFKELRGISKSGQKKPLSSSMESIFPESSL
ncbi:MAG: hypothetical protein V4489_01760 [Chlamydiota bacterium]